MKGSIIVVGLFLLGSFLGWIGSLPSFLLEGDITIYVLYLLMFQVGLSIGSDKKLKEILRSIRLRLLLVPFATIIGTLSFSALISLFISQWSVFDCLAYKEIISCFALWIIVHYFILKHQYNNMRKTGEKLNENFGQPSIIYSGFLAFVFFAFQFWRFLLRYHQAQRVFLQPGQIY